MSKPALEGQWALVTGAGRGIGRAVALDLSRLGASVALLSRNRHDLEVVARECQELGAPQALVMPTDLSRPVEIDDAVDFVQSLSGGIDVLVNNAGIHVGGNALEGEPAQWDTMLAINLSAPMRLTRLLAPGMVARKRGLIINIGSVAGVEPAMSGAAYGASKYGLRGWSLSCYQTLRNHNVRVVLVNPGFVDTEMTRDLRGAQRERLLRPEDVSRAALFAVQESANCCPQEITLRLTLPARDA